jgi:hypothetical protein
MNTWVPSGFVVGVGRANMDKHFVLIYDCLWSKLHKFFTFCSSCIHKWIGWGSITTFTWILISRSNWFWSHFHFRDATFLSFDIDLWSLIWMWIAIRQCKSYHHVQIITLLSGQFTHFNGTCFRCYTQDNNLCQKRFFLCLLIPILGSF